MPRSNRGSHSKKTFFKQTTYRSGEPEVKLTKEQIAQDAADQKKFYMVLGGLVVFVLIIIYFLFIRHL
jgi:hypothetical protein